MDKLEFFIRGTLCVITTFLFLNIGPVLFNIDSMFLVLVWVLMLFSYPFVIYLILFYELKRKD